MKTYHYVIKGQVQGVNFRWYTLRTARNYSIKGTVQNLWDSDVEVYAQGEPENIRIFEEFLHEGPTFARVTDVSKEEFELEQVYEIFEII